MRQPPTVTATSASRQEALKIKQQNSRPAPNLGLRERVAAEGQVVPVTEVASERHCSRLYFFINFYFPYFVPLFCPCRNDM